MASFEHLLKTYDVADALDDIASADPPAYLRRTFAEGISTPSLSWPRLQQLAVCAMVLDAVINDREYESFEPELIADWRHHYVLECAPLKPTALAALRRGLEASRAVGAEAAAELDELLHRLGNG